MCWLLDLASIYNIPQSGMNQIKKEKQRKGNEMCNDEDKEPAETSTPSSEGIFLLELSARRQKLGGYNSILLLNRLRYFSSECL